MDNESKKKGRTMKITVLVAVFLTTAVLAAVGQEGAVETVKHGVQKAGEKVKEGAETVGEKTKEAAETVGEKTKELWRNTKAYASSNHATYHRGARQKLTDLGREVAELKNRRSEASDPQAFDSQLDTLTQQHATAERELSRLENARSKKNYTEAREQFNKTVEEIEEGLAQARKQLRG